MLLGIALKISFVVAVTGHGIDLSTTQRCIGANRCTEMNHFLGRFDDPIGFAVAKMGIAGTSEVFVYDFSKENPKKAVLINAAIGGIFTGIGIHNYNVSK